MQPPTDIQYQQQHIHFNDSHSKHHAGIIAH